MQKQILSTIVQKQIQAAYQKWAKDSFQLQADFNMHKMPIEVYNHRCKELQRICADSIFTYVDIEKP